MFKIQKPNLSDNRTALRAPAASYPKRYAFNPSP